MSGVPASSAFRDRGFALRPTVPIDLLDAVEDGYPPSLITMISTTHTLDIATPTVKMMRPGSSLIRDA